MVIPVECDEGIPGRDLDGRQELPSNLQASLLQFLFLALAPLPLSRERSLKGTVVSQLNIDHYSCIHYRWKHKGGREHGLGNWPFHVLY